MDISLWVWTALIAALLAMLLFDLLMHRDAHEIGVREAATWSAIWVTIGVAMLLFDLLINRAWPVMRLRGVWPA